MNTELLPTGAPGELSAAVERASGLLASGAAVALPTETVYGLAADALRPDAVLKVFEAKERPFFDPLICHLPSRDWLARMTRIPNESQRIVEALIERFWPGPLTLVLPRSEAVPDVVTSGLETVAVRMSAHPVFRAVVERFGCPLAAPSANRFGRISPTQASHVMSELGGRIPLIVDGGPAAHGIESTIVAIAVDGMRVLRPGPISQEELADVWTKAGGSRRGSSGEPAGFNAAPIRHSDAMEAPGTLASHYAPQTALRILDREFRSEGRRIGLLAFCAVPSSPAYTRVEILSATGDLGESAANLFAKLRLLDDVGLDLIVAEPVPEHGLGIAIMDRLRKAAGMG